MVNINDAYPSKYLKASDLKGTEPKVIIASVDVEEISKTDRKLVMYFRGKDKGMVCNKTNAMRIGFSYGEDTDEWIGKPIVLYGEVVDFQGKPTLSLRVRVPNAAAMAAAQAPAPKPAPTPTPVDLDDDMPF